jgi:hypothetical protein
MNLYPISSLFFYRLIFMFWLLSGEGLFAYHLKRRNHFVLRVIPAILLSFGFALAFPIPTGNSFYTMMMFFCFFAFTFLLLFFCFDANWKTLFFIALCGYTMEHTSYCLYQGIFSFLNASFQLSQTGLYDNTSLNLFGGGVIEMAVYFTSYILVYWLVFILLATKVKGYEGTGVKSGEALILGFIFLGIDIVFSSVISAYSTIHYDGNYLGFIGFLNAACCIAALIGLFQLFFRNTARKNLEFSEELRRQEKSQYEMQKQTIDLINIKCHDLKYQIRQMGSEKAMSPDVVESMTKVINIYDSAIKTGNTALDVVLSQKSLFCSQNQIRFSAIADGSALSFMNEPDTYSLFGNIIDNAVEAVKGLSPEKRLISLQIKKTGNLVSVSVKNSYEGNIVFQNGFPVTRKEDKSYHGFGLRSIALVTEKYKGTMTLDAKNGIFAVALLFPQESR